MKRFICILLTLLMLVPFGINAAKAGFDPQMPFRDAKPGAWYYSAVKYCKTRSLLNGMTEEKFGLNTTVSRAMFVQALANFEGVTADMLKKEPTPFTDIKPSHWFYVAVEWARQQGIVGGMTDTTFSPNGALTRAQMARLFCQYAKFKGLDTNKKADLSAFTDAASIPAWASEGMEYCVAEGLFVGDAGKLTPSAKATRAQLAVVLYKFDYQNKYGHPIPDSTAADSMLVEADSKDRVVVFGDSMAQRLEKDPLRSKYLKIPVQNYGIGGEMAEAAAFRQGSIAIYATPMTIPADKTPVPVTFVTDNGDEKDLGVFGDGVSNEFTIAGVIGKVAYTDGKAYFTRVTEGEAVEVTNLTRVITPAMQDRRDNDILVIWTGSNNRYNAANAYKLVDTINEMIAYHSNDEYVIVGLTSKDYMAEVDGVNDVLREAFGEHFVDVRAYLMTEQCLLDNGITPSPADYDNMAKGEIPASLLADSIHGTATFYDIVSKMIAEAIEELGYLA
ncbi:MAG: S-layer homology domain-containing protein [Clostridia bacterium]|nr:S-layer homology domain-containing protein [Clostridia bacterium]